MKTTTQQPTMPDLSGFDYTKLTGDDYKKYIAIAGEFGVDENGRPRYKTELQLNEKYFYEQWKAIGEKKFRLNEDTGEREEYIAGIRLTGATPIMRTKITAKNAIDLNTQLSTNPQEHANSKFYLLAKDQ
jgi:hypothetical protein